MGHTAGPERFDVIVVGARCAGSPLATMLARSGLRVCLLDRARFPSDTPSTHGIQPTGVKILRALGLGDRLARVGAVVDRGSVAFDDVRLEIDGVTDRVGAPMLNIRRVTLDAILVETAATAGAEVRTGTAVTGLLAENGRVVGVRTRDGALEAPLVVGADGVRSAVARMVGARDYHRIPCSRLFMWAYFEGATADDDRVWIGKIGDNGYLASATDAGQFMLAVVPSEGGGKELRGNRETAFAEGLAHWPELEACVAGATRVGSIRVMSGMTGYLRESAGPGWVLVGDAGHFKDPSPGQGIADALRQVVELAPAIERALGGATDADAVLRDWWEWRDRDAWEMYRFAAQLGEAGPTPALLFEVQRRMQGDPRLVDGLVRVLNHDVPPSKVFTPAVGLRALAGALRRGRGRRRALLREARTLMADELRNRRPPAPPTPAPRATSPEQLVGEVAIAQRGPS